MKAWILRWLGMQPSNNNQTFPSNGQDKTVDILKSAYESHITSLREEIARQAEMIQVLSDDKFFKPKFVNRDQPVPDTEHTFELSDYSFQNEGVLPIKEEEPEVDILSELSKLEKEYTKSRGK